MITARVELTDYANKVLSIIKIKFGLRDKSEALNKFVDLYGEEFQEKEVKEEYVQKIIQQASQHAQKHKNRRMSVEELDQLCEAK